MRTALNRLWIAVSADYLGCCRVVSYPGVWRGVVPLGLLRRGGDSALLNPHRLPTAVARLAFNDLRAVALSPADSVVFIERLARQV